MFNDVRKNTDVVNGLPRYIVDFPTDHIPAPLNGQFLPCDSARMFGILQPGDSKSALVGSKQKISFATSNLQKATIVGGAIAIQQIEVQIGGLLLQFMNNPAAIVGRAAKDVVCGTDT